MSHASANDSRAIEVTASTRPPGVERVGPPRTRMAAVAAAEAALGVFAHEATVAQIDWLWEQRAALAA